MENKGFECSKSILERLPLLKSIHSPSDLRKLDITGLERLCDEIRRFLIASLATNPGHFASSMGAVELTVALHYVYNTPYDRIVWDVGHQAYGHKLLTGRAEEFDTNRHLGGLSGFPNPDESPYDTFTAGHASNSISAALGMSIATSLLHEDPLRHVVAVIGDAAISGGLAFEGLNNAANSSNNLLIILNDNDMSIDRNVGSLNSYLTHITTSKSYNDFRYKTYQKLKSLKLVNERNRGSILRFNNSLKSLITHEQNIFEGLNIRYFGPFDGHDLRRILRVLTDIKDMKGPRLLHLRTIKGKGFKEAERNPAAWHAPGKFDPDTGRRDKPENASMLPLKYQEVFGRTLVDLARKNGKVVGITAGMLSGTSVNMLKEAFPNRTFDVGITEGHAVTFAGGLAKEGLRPFVAIYSSFLQRSYDHIIHDVAIQRLPVTFCIDRAGIVGEDGVTHHGAFDLSYMRSIPGMTVSAPRNELYLSRLMYTAEQLDGPMSIRYPRGSGVISRDTDNYPGENATAPLPIGKAEKLADGDDVAMLSIGTIARETSQAISKAGEQGIHAAHYDMIFLKPLDTCLIAALGEKGTPIVTVEDGTAVGGLGSAVMETLHSMGYNNHVERIALPDSFIPHGSVGELKKLAGIDASSIAQAITRASKHSSK